MEEQIAVTIDPQQTEVANQPQEAELSTNNPHIHKFALHDDIENKWFCTCGEKSDEQTVVKAPPVPGAGPKCKYCKKKEKYQSLADDYIGKYLNAKTEKLSIPFVEELAILLRVDHYTLKEWADRKVKGTDEYEHPEFRDTYALLLELQRLRLLQRTLGRYNPTGAIFQLKVNHGMIETEKKIVAGDSTEPLVIELINEKPLPEQQNG